MIKILTVIGARPQFVKAAVVSRQISRHENMREILVHTGQHYDKHMSELFFSQLDIPEPDYNLEIGSGPHGAQTGRMLEKLEQVMLEHKPHCVLIYGDTNSTIAGALAAVKLHIPVVHVEAGMRSFNRQMPEEVNRVASDHISNVLITSTPTATKNLENEGISPDKIFQTGDVMFDAARFYAQKALKESSILNTLGLAESGFALATVHRAANTDNPDTLGEIFEGLCRISTHKKVVFPVHPRTLKQLKAAGILSQDIALNHTGKNGIMLCNPLGYLDMVMLEKNCCAVITDSGGVQKEAYFHHKPCLTIREQTEWTELVEGGWNTLCGACADKIEQTFARITSAPMPEINPTLYGNADAGEKIVQTLCDLFTDK